MDDETGESTEPMEEVPLKNWVSQNQGRPAVHLMTTITYSESLGGSYECC